MEIQKAKKIHFVGISGIGISGLAMICLELGKNVTGSDLVESIVTKGLKAKGAKITIGKHKGNNVSADIDLLVYSNAVPEENIERKRAKKNSVEEMSYPQALGRFTSKKKLICVSGMHGKTTTTAMIASVLKEAGYDPTFIVGSYLKELGGNAALGKSDYIVIEADEFARAMLNYYPDYIVLNNIEEDHLDTYKDIDDIKRTFKKYVLNLTMSGVLIANADDKNVKDVSKVTEARVVNYGIKKGEYKAKNIKETKDAVTFEVGGSSFKLKIPGRYNIYNALATITLTAGLGIADDVIKKGLASFKGSWRRFELLGEYQGAPVISDYAHHPTEINALLSAAKIKYPKKRIVLAFQPHQHNRTKNLFKNFVKVLKKANVLILNEIYDVPGREAKMDQDVSSEDLVREVMVKKKEVYYAKNLKGMEALIKKKVKKGDVLLIVGAGDIYKLGEGLIKK